jgi:hypothetical protein
VALSACRLLSTTAGAGRRAARAAVQAAFALAFALANLAPLRGRSPPRPACLFREHDLALGQGHAEERRVAP